MYLLGFDIGSSSVKVSLVNGENGACVASSFYPKEEMKIKLNEKKYALYKQVIGRFEGISLTNNGNQYFLNTKKSNHYTFKNNYCFMLVPQQQTYKAEECFHTLKMILNKQKF